MVMWRIRLQLKRPMSNRHIAEGVISRERLLETSTTDVAPWTYDIAPYINFHVVMVTIRCYMPPALMSATPTSANPMPKY